MRLLALIAALVVFAFWVQWRTDHPSPGEGPPLGEWLKSLVRRDTDPDPDTDPDTDDDEDLDDDDCDCVRCVRRRKPPAEPVDKGPSQLDIWVGRSLDTGAAYTDIVREGVEMFGVGEATVKRAIRRVRDARAGNPA